MRLSRSPLDGASRRRIASLRGRSGHPPAVILGMGSNGLGYVRSLRSHAVPAIALDAWRDPAMWSRYCIPVVVPHPEREEAALLRLLEDLAHVLPDRAALLPTSDDFLLFAATHGSELGRLYEMNVPSRDAALACVNKRLQYECAHRAGIPTPHTVFPEDTGIESAASDVTFPCLLKPYYGHRWQEHMATSGRRKGKVLEVTNRRALVDVYGIARKTGLEFLVQEKVPGEDDRLWALQTYLDPSGVPKAVFTKRKLRQFPRGVGDSSFQIGARHDEVISLGLDLLAALGHRGCAGVEFKDDPRDGRLKLIEANPRSLATNHHAVVSGVDIPFVHYRDVLREPVAREDRFREGIKWVHLSRDLPAFLEYWAAGDMDLAGWLASWRGRRCYAYFDWEDPLPACVDFVASTRFLLRTMLRARADRARLGP